MVDTKVVLGGLEMATPVATASGTFGYGAEYAGVVDYAKIGAITTKGVRLSAWPGNAMPRHIEVPGGLVNAIGLQGSGADALLSVFLPYYADAVRGNANDSDCRVPPAIVNIWGGSIEEYAEVAAKVTAFKSSGKQGGEIVGAIECNVSCPNVKEGGHTFGQDPAVLARLVAAVRATTDLPLVVKLAPNVPDVAPYAKACEDAGADALSMINTLPAMVIDIERRVPALGNRTGGLSGRAVHPVAVKLVYDAHRAVRLPILAMGGVYDAMDAVEFMLAGATAVAVGTSGFTDPTTAARVFDGIVDYCERHGFSSVADLTGALCES